MFVAKAVLGLAMTTMLIERLKVDKTLRRLCGWERLGQFGLVAVGGEILR